MEKTLHEVRSAKLPAVDRTRELAWLEIHRIEYAGQWVVLDEGRLLGSGSDPRPLLAEARAAGSARALVLRVPEAEAEPFTGGWL